MNTQIPVIISIASMVFWGVLVLSLLVVLHEAGHFILARVCGMRVSEFFVGMPCKIKASLHLRHWGTEVGITPLLLGGYTRICGMSTYQSPYAEAVLAYVYSVGRCSVSECARSVQCSEDEAYDALMMLADWCSIRKVLPAQAEKLAACSNAQHDSAEGAQYDPQKDLQKGLHLEDHHENEDNSQNVSAAERSWYSTVYFETMQRDAHNRTMFDTGHNFTSPNTHLQGAPNPQADAHAFYVSEMRSTYNGKGFVPRMLALAAGPVFNIIGAFVIVVVALSIIGFNAPTNSNTLGAVDPNSYAAQLGMSAGDTIIAVNDVSTPTWSDVVAAITTHMREQKPFSLEYTRDDVHKRVDVDPSQCKQHFGIYAQFALTHLSPLQSITVAQRYFSSTMEFIVNLFIPQHTLETISQSSSVVGISRFAAQAAERGLESFLMFCAMISMSLGCMNLLPIPPLDGGKALFEIIQAITRRPVSPKVQAVVLYIGLAFIGVIFLFALYNDIAPML